MDAFRRICVYCGSRTGVGKQYIEAALEVADYLVAHQICLVNGGGSVGLMGIMADRVLDLGGEAIGVIPLGLKEKEVAHSGMTELIVVPDMHSRKMTMVNLSDAFIALPGGFGTLDELFETLTWSQLHLHQKPVGLLNVGGYFDPLLEMADRMVQHGFLREDTRLLINVGKQISGLVESMQVPVVTADKWD